MAKTIPYSGQMMDIAPYSLKMSKITVGPATTYDVYPNTTGAFALWNVPAGCVVLDVLANIKTAAGAGSTAIKIGDCGDDDGFFTDTLLADTVVSSQFKRSSCVGTEYATGKEYTAADVISATLTTAADIALIMDLYLIYSLAGCDTN
jgi:hypothetical protein